MVETASAEGLRLIGQHDLGGHGDGLVDVTDRGGGGLAVLEPEPWLATLMDRSHTNP